MSVPPDRAISEHVQPVDGMILISDDLARVIVHWLGQYAEQCRQRSGIAPDRLRDVQQLLAEAAIAYSRPRERLPISNRISPGDSVRDSRRREIAGRCLDLDLLSGDAGFVSPSEAADMLGITADAVRWRCRSGKLPSRKAGRRTVIPVSALNGL
ncbi:helix-turn-helix domain-containing protein [[Mycobacterium] zoologicum]|uniref:helix-turn-helix domain-containing protein n=1 Tax=[Mycobacterium] zoologicum TaxID=2872311 RepID=UPI001CDA9A48|nr:helix-turn-helix domain-containing protein [Mycolicibacter sp. MYC101]MEB3062479.1 helix-turn-helix domain-containing protein [Mycolicibacter sp. MYC101]